MSRQVAVSVENTFIKGLITDSNGLNFPEDACTDTDNCVFSITGEVSRRAGIDFELNSTGFGVDTTGKVKSSYKWNNAGGDGETQVLVQQVGASLYFYLSSSATNALPLSHQRLATVVDLNTFGISGQTAEAIECQYSDGNGYLFVFHPNLTPLYCTYNPSNGVIQAASIVIQIRDFNGIVEGTPVTLRPSSLSTQHQYNLSNQGWTAGSLWTAVDSTTTFSSVTTGSHTFAITAGLPIVNGDNVVVFGPVQTYGPGQDISVPVMTGSVTSYAGTVLVLNVYSVLANTVGGFGALALGPMTLSPINSGYINTWFSEIGNYPSNSDIWWRFKNTSNIFNPGVTNVSVTLNSGPAPGGHFIIDAFKQQRALIAGISGLTNVITTTRPKTGTWFQGRVWYAGVDASQVATGDQLHYSWSENVYFSQVVQNISQIGSCYQNNDPTSQNFADLLPTDGGVIRIQGSGSIFKLFPIQNGLLVFASNGIYFITGSQGIGFTANDYSVNQISSVQSISSSSFINVLGYPMFWNEEGIYAVTPNQQGNGITVNNLCIGTISDFYSDIPMLSKKYARGDYNPITYVVSWVYNSANETNLTSRYKYNRVLNFNTSSKAFYPWTIGGEATVHDVKYIAHPGGSAAPSPVMKFFTSFSSGQFTTFSEEWDTTRWIDFTSDLGGSANYTSYFITGYRVRGQAIRRFQPIYTEVFSNSPGVVTAYKIQGIWDYANSSNSGRYSNTQLITNDTPNYGVIHKRHKIRGHGLALQLKFTSVNNEPFYIIGWSIMDGANASI